ncbi:MAG: Gfo/Idh/MocA family oxidoreductase [Bacteroidaceae bacterium]|nr:Gfo/Idh/MocA family oxidoreductase [Bacteroidaceae bacterium]
MLQQVIDRFKRQRTEAFLRRTYGRRYAFVGMGQHSLTNLYPVLHYLGVPLKYICVTNAEKAALISRKYPSTQGTTDLNAVLADPEVAGVFVAASPRAHFALAQRVVAAGKHLFIEKPPCLTTDELSTLQQAAEKGTGAVVVGLQKRYAPAVRILGKRLRQEHGAVSYDLHYQTGAYPEGDALTDLFIHPLDLAVHLFGPATVLSAQRPTKSSFLLMLKHGDAVGTLELSTDYTWTSAHESLHVVTPSALYDLDNLDTLTRRPKQSTLFGVPMEKVHPAVPAVQHLYGRNTFNPVPQNNTLVAQGFYDELLAFTELCEGRPADNLTPLSSLTDTFRLMGALRNV